MRLRTFLALALASAFLIIAGPAAQAVAYPPTTCPTLSVSTTTPLAGESITVSGTNFAAGAHVRLELHTKVFVLANVTTSAQGTFSTSVTMPAGVVGSHTIVAVGGAVPGCPQPVQTVTLQTGGQSTGANGGGSNGGGTAFTGVDVLLLVLIAALLVSAGVMLNRGGKRRRPVYPNEIG